MDMKRILLIAICAMLVISLAACAARNTETAEEPVRRISGRMDY